MLVTRLPRGSPVVHEGKDIQHISIPREGADVIELRRLLSDEIQKIRDIDLVSACGRAGAEEAAASSASG
jgi:hypothetical protein